MESVKIIKAKRGQLKAQLTFFANHIEKIDENRLDELLIRNLIDRKNKIEPLIDKFDTTQLDLSELIEEAEMEQEMIEYEIFQNRYFDLNSKAVHLIAKFNSLNTNNFDDEVTSVKSSNHSQPHAQVAHVKLPQIKLPTFDGTFTMWNNFSDSFMAMIDNNTELSDCQKLCYLRASLMNEPLNMISALDTIDINYSIAWHTLKKRYDNKRRIITSHINNILNIPDIGKESNFKLRNFLDTIQIHIQSLKALKLAPEQWDPLLLPVLVNKLDNKTVHDWESHVNSTLTTDDIPSYDQLIKFLEKRISILEALEHRKPPTLTHNFKPELKPKGVVKAYATTNISCSVCNGEHFVQYCKTFLDLQPRNRFEKAKSLKLCTNCLRKGHYYTNCQSSKCRSCNGNHHTLLHEVFKKSQSKNTVHSQQSHSSQRAQNSQQIQFSQTHDTNSNSNNQNLSHTTTLSSTTNNHFEILLPTVIVDAISLDGTVVPLRCLLDSASQSHFISERACQLLNLPLSKTNMSITGVNQCTSSSLQKTQLVIASKFTKFNSNINCFVLPEITGVIPGININKQNFKIPSTIKLADPTFNKSGHIDLLIGASLFWEIICRGQIQTENGITFQKTLFGWIVTGQVNLTRSNSITCLTLNDIHNQLQQFWKVDEFQSKCPLLTLDEEKCEKIFETTTIRSVKDNRFIVKMPIKSDINKLGDSYDIAKSRLLMLEKKFAKQPNFKCLYVDCINDYKEQGHLSEAKINEPFEFYLPHHAVIKESSESTKLRVVFDGSCKLNSGLSINELQYVGPTLQEDLFSIITRFRTHKFVFTADIKQMYRQIWLNSEDRKFQKILWRENETEPIKSYQLNTVTFGLTSSPYLAIKCLMKLAEINKTLYPKESKIITTDFYVDDVLTGASSIESLLTLKTNLTKILNQAGFFLTKFKGNTPELNSSNGNVVLAEPIKALGVLWNPNTDQFVFSSFNVNPNKAVVTKRTILATTATLFDPIGFLSPIIIIAKLIIQDLWQLKLDWDDAVPPELQNKWLNYLESLPLVHDIIVPRYILASNYSHLEMHGFSDASERAYGACIYIRCIDDTGKIIINLLASKSRVAPLRNITLPRLELLAAVLLTKLIVKFKEILNLKFSKEYWWTDSKIVLSWLQSHPSKWSTFIANRVSFIQEHTNILDWYHVSSSDNPADIISRGMLPTNLKNSNLWWNGPSFLSENQELSFNQLEVISSDNLPEQKRRSKTLISLKMQPIIDINKFSTFSRLIRTLAWCIHFRNKCLAKLRARKGLQFDISTNNVLTTKLLNQSKSIIIRIIQQECFAEEYKLLKTKLPIKSKSAILALNPFMDENDIIRVGGRLNNSKFNFDKKHPILLPKHHFTDLLLKENHKHLLHAGPTLLLSVTREKYWPLNGRNTAKRIVRSCVRCFKFNPRSTNPLMGNLPPERVTPGPPFFCTGIDYAGPLSVRDRTGRGAKISKCYISLFICLATKAIHIEPVTSLTTKAFLAALRRFVARRGKPQKILSDNGTNFHGANTELKSFYDWLKSQEICLSESINNEGIEWQFIPPQSPNFGGLWEAGVKSTKHHLKRVLGNAILTFEELYTVLAQIESLLNSRPLTLLNSDPNDIQTLTPAHFLIGRPYTTVADPDMTDQPINRLDRYQFLQRLHQDFWNQWSTEYISQLQQRAKWKLNSANIAIDTIVLLKEDNLHPSYWKLGKVVALHPGKDAIVRVVSVECCKKVFKRPVSKVCPLPICNDKLTISEQN